MRCTPCCIAALAVATASLRAQTPTGTAFTYQGLLESGGVRAAGPHDLEFRLFNAEAGGAQVGATACADNVALDEGRFTVRLDFGPVFSAGARWLQVGVRADATPGNCGSGVFTVLSPRQRVTPAPVAVAAWSAAALDAPDGAPAGAVVVDNSGLVGVGTATPGMSLEVSTPSLYGKPALGASDGPSAWAYLHVSGSGSHSLVWDAGHALRFGTESARGSGYAERVRISPEGYLGIGTTSPQGPLDVAGPFGSYLRFDSAFGDVRFNGGNDGVFAFFNEGAPTGRTTFVAQGAERLVVLNNGNVGIGTATPSHTLDVNGTFFVYTGSRRLISVFGGQQGGIVNFFNQFDNPSATIGADGGGFGYLQTDTLIARQSISAPVKNFRVPNPGDPGTEIVYACIEGPEAAAYVRGTGLLTDGEATVALPAHFTDVAAPEGLTVQVTPRSAESKGLAVVERSTERFVVRELLQGRGSYEFDWEVKAVRRGQEGYRVIRPRGE